MIRVHYLDGQTIDVAADGWRVNGPVLEVGAFTTPLVHVRGWEVLPDPAIPATD